MTGDLPLFLRLDDIELDVEELESLANALAYAVGMFADPAREHDPVQATHQCRIRADCLAHRRAKDIDGKFRVRVGAFQKGLHVVVRVGKTLEAALLVDQLFE